MSYTLEFWALPQENAAALARGTHDANEFVDAVQDAGVFYDSTGYSSSGGQSFREELETLGQHVGLPVFEWVVGPNPDLPYEAPVDFTGYPSTSGFSARQAALLADALEPLLESAYDQDGTLNGTGLFGENEYREGAFDPDALEAAQTLLSVVMDACDRNTDITTLCF
jgi:hypothetical protein